MRLWLVNAVHSQCELESIRDIQFFKCCAKVRFDCSFRDMAVLRNLLIRGAIGSQDRDFFFSVCQLFRPLFIWLGC